MQSNLVKSSVAGLQLSQQPVNAPLEAKQEHGDEVLRDVEAAHKLFWEQNRRCDAIQRLDLAAAKAVDPGSVARIRVGGAFYDLSLYHRGWQRSLQLPLGFDDACNKKAIEYLASPEGSEDRFEALVDRLSHSMIGCARYNAIGYLWWLRPLGRFDVETFHEALREWARSFGASAEKSFSQGRVLLQQQQDPVSKEIIVSQIIPAFERCVQQSGTLLSRQAFGPWERHQREAISCLDELSKMPWAAKEMARIVSHLEKRRSLFSLRGQKSADRISRRVGLNGVGS